MSENRSLSWTNYFSWKVEIIYGYQAGHSNSGYHWNDNKVLEYFHSIHFFPNSSKCLQQLHLRNCRLGFFFCVFCGWHWTFLNHDKWLLWTWLYFRLSIGSFYANNTSFRLRCYIHFWCTSIQGIPKHAYILQQRLRNHYISRTIWIVSDVALGFHHVAFSANFMFWWNCSSKMTFFIITST